MPKPLKLYKVVESGNLGTVTRFIMAESRLQAAAEMAEQLDIDGLIDDDSKISTTIIHNINEVPVKLRDTESVFYAMVTDPEHPVMKLDFLPSTPREVFNALRKARA